MYDREGGSRTGKLHTEASETDLGYMRRCIDLAREAQSWGDYPVGALVVRGGEILGSGAESTKRLLDVAAHAEVEAIRAACRKVGALDLGGATLYTTVEPCYLCSFAIRQLKFARVVIARAYPQAGGVSSRHPILLDAAIPHWGAPPEVVTGVLEDECGALFREY